MTTMTVCFSFSLSCLASFLINFSSQTVGVTLTKKKNFVSKGGERAGNVQELRDRLQAKLTDLQSGRGEGKKAQRKKMSKEEKQLKKKEELRLKAKLAKMNASKPVALANGTSKAKPVYNSEGKMVFSKFDFTSSNGPVDQKAAGKKTKDPKAALQSIQKAKDKLKRLESSGETEKIKAIEVGSAWSKAMEKTSGAKVKDDVGLLKKSIKKQEQRKKSSKKKWDDRREGEKRGKEARISKREENIGKRKKDNKDTKMKKLAKKGRNIPGFR
jgi:hypothetical protein